MGTIVDHVNNNADGTMLPPPASDKPGLPGDAPRIEKERIIRRACSERNFADLVLLADSPGGLLEDALRREACRYSSLVHCPYC